MFKSTISIPIPFAPGPEETHEIAIIEKFSFFSILIEPNEKRSKHGNNNIEGYRKYFLIVLKLRNIMNCPSCVLTARQYGEVVLPDEAPVTGPGSLARNFSRCKAGMARVFAVMA
jgi:hypothetical protein